jgi:hypothetical protein
MAGSRVDADVLQPVVAATAIRRSKPVVRQVDGVPVERELWVDFETVDRRNERGLLPRLAIV